MDGIGYVNIIFTQNGSHPDSVEIEWDNDVVVDGDYDKSTGAFTGTFLGSYEADHIYRISGIAKSDNGAIAKVEYEQAFSTIEGMTLDVSNIRVSKKNILEADLKLTIGRGIRLPKRVFPSLVALATKGTKKRISTVSWDSKTNTGTIGFQLCDDCAEESMRAIEANLEVDDKLITYNVKYLTPSLSIKKESMVVKDGVIGLKYSLQNSDTLIPTSVVVENVSVSVVGDYPVLFPVVESKYNTNNGELTFSVPVKVPTKGPVDFEVAGTVNINKGTISRKFSEKDVSYVTTTGIVTRVIRHEINPDTFTEKVTLDSTLKEGGSPLRIKLAGIVPNDIERVLISMTYDPTTGRSVLVFKSKFNKDVKFTSTISGILDYPDYNIKGEVFKSSVVPKFYLVPPRVRLLGSVLKREDGRTYLVSDFEMRLKDGSIPKGVAWDPELKDVTFSDIKVKGDVSIKINDNGRGTITYPILDQRYISGKLNFGVTFKLPLYTKDNYYTLFEDVLKFPLEAQYHGQRISFDDQRGTVKLTQYIRDRHGDIPKHVMVEDKPSVHEGIEPELYSTGYDVIGGELVLEFKALDSKLPLDQYKIGIGICPLGSTVYTKLSIRK